jgi:hypothetical protein
MRVRSNRCVVLMLIALLAAACGDDDDGDAADGGGDDAADGGDGDPGDDSAGDDDGAGDGEEADAGPFVCTAQSEYACGNCIDDDLDGLIDGQDPQCQGPEDRLEDSFATGIPGDNQDRKKQECFFDGDSGQCQVHTCCLLPDGACPDDLLPFDREQDCDNLDAPCLSDCLPNTPVGCDCYGCCTVCNPDTDDCADILLGGAPAGCDPTDIGTATMSECLSCVKVETCNGGECDENPDDCVLCPGQNGDDLPDTCDANECPEGETVCQSSDDCDGLDYCSNGCCRAGGVD